MRSLLLARFDTAPHRAAALDAGADAMVVDVGANDEAAARDLFAQARAIGRARLFVRLSTPLDEDGAEVARAMALAPDGVVLRGPTDGARTQQLAARLAVGEATFGARDGSTGIIVAIAAPTSLFALGSFAQASARLLALVFDAGDLADSCRSAAGAPPSDAALALARNLTLFAARAAGVPVFDAALPDARSGRVAAARREGFDGLWTTNPGDVATINAAFAAPP